MLNRKIFLICCTVFIIMFVITSVVLISDVSKGSVENTVTSGVSASNSEHDNKSELLAETTYLVTSGDGVLCVYNCSENAQILIDAITYIDLYSLDSNTRQSLENGIVFENRIEVIRFIENISS